LFHFHIPVSRSFRAQLNQPRKEQIRTHDIAVLRPTTTDRKSCLPRKIEVAMFIPRPGDIQVALLHILSCSTATTRQLDTSDMPASHQQTAYYDDVGLWVDLPPASATPAIKHGLLREGIPESGPLHQLHLGVFGSSGHVGGVSRQGRIGGCDETECVETLTEVMCHVLLGTVAALLFIALPLALWNWAMSQRRRTTTTGRVEL